MSTIDRSTLGYLGDTFQFKLVKAFMEEDGFLMSIYSAVDQNTFNANGLNRFVGVIKDYVDKYEMLPTYDIVEFKLREKATNDIDIEQAQSLVKKVRNTDYSGVEDIKNVAIRFFRQQKMIKVANRILKITGEGNGNIENYDECLNLMESAMNVGKEDSEGVSPFELIDEALSPDYHVQIPTGIDKLDKIMRGGLDKGKLGVIIGSAGFGKSTMTTAFSAYASTYKCEANNYEGFKVLQIFFEDDMVDITKKHFSRITQIEARDLTDSNDRITQVRNTLNNWPDKELMVKNLRLKRFDTGEKTATEIFQYIKKCINNGFKPDMVALDYFECLKNERDKYSNDSEWTSEGKTIRKLEQMANKLNIALWVPVQGNKESINSQVVTMDKAGGSIKKVQVAHVIISIARTLEDADNNRASLYLLKNRGGKANVAFENISFNNGTSTISCDEGMPISQKLDLDNQIKEQKANETLNMGRQKLNELSNNQNAYNSNQYVQQNSTSQFCATGFPPSSGVPSNPNEWNFGRDGF